MKAKLAVCLTLILLLAAGCDANKANITEETIKPPSQNNIIAIINGVCVDEYGLYRYTETAKIYWQAVADTCKKGVQPSTSLVEDPLFQDLIQGGLDSDDKEMAQSLSEEYRKLQESLLNLAYDRAQKRIQQNEDEWKNEYLKTFVIDNKILSLKSETDYEAINNFDKSIQEDIKNDRIPILNNSSEFSLSNTLSALSQEFNLSKDECLDTVLKPFMKSMYETDYLRMYFNYNSRVNETDEDDSPVSEQYPKELKNLYDQYDKYTDSLLLEANIIYK